jgi:glycosyltransferase involved in cell wall biosynthesis
VLKIVVVCPTKAEFDSSSLSDSRLGGIETASIELSRALAVRGHQVTLATRTTSSSEHYGVATIPIDEFSQHQCDVLVSSNDARVFNMNPSVKKKVLWIHNPLALEKALRKFQILPLLKHRPDAVFVGTEAEKQMSSFYPFRSRTVIPHGISEVFLQATPHASRKDHFVWASQRQRGLAETIEAWKSYVVPTEKNASFHIFGSRANELGLTDETASRSRIFFHGSKLKSELAEFYASAKAMIYPGALDETFCMAAAEAQAMGLPVITLGIGSLSERVQQGVNGIICGSYRELGYQACRMVDDEELWQCLHEGALRIARLLTWQRTGKLWEALILRKGSSH